MLRRKYEEAQGRCLELQQDFPNSDEIGQKLSILGAVDRSRKLFKEGKHAFQQGEFAEAVRALTEALDLNPRMAMHVNSGIWRSGT